MGGRGREIVDVMVLRLEGKLMSACISLIKPSHHQRFPFKKNCKRDKHIPFSNFFLLFSFLIAYCEQCWI